MSLFRILWLRRLVRRYTKPIAETHAETWKKRLSLMYMFIAWNAVGVICYAAYNGKLDWAKYYGIQKEDNLSPARQYASILGINNSKVIRVSGLHLSSYEIKESDETSEAQS